MRKPIKQVITAVLCVTFLLTLTSCKPDYSKKFKDYSWSVGEQSTYTFTDAIELTLVEGSETDEGAYFQMHNPTEHLYYYGAWYAFEICLDDVWYSMDGCLVDFILIANLLGPGENVECRAIGAYGLLAPGQYRVIKDVKREDGTGGTAYICAEFTIE